MKKIIAALALSLGLIMPGSAYAYPDGPVTFIVPYSPSGNTDVFTRMLRLILRNSGVRRSSSTTSRVVARWSARRTSPRRSPMARPC